MLIVLVLILTCSCSLAYAQAHTHALLQHHSITHISPYSIGSWYFHNTTTMDLRCFGAAAAALLNIIVHVS